MRRLGTCLLAAGVLWVGWVAGSFVLRAGPFSGGGQQELELGPATLVALFLIVWMWAAPGALAIAAGTILRRPSSEDASGGELVAGNG